MLSLGANPPPARTAVEPWVPLEGVIVRLGPWIVYTADPTALSENPGATATHWIVSVLPTLIGPLTLVDDSVGVLLSVVQNMLAPGVASLTLTLWTLL